MVDVLFEDILSNRRSGQRILDLTEDSFQYWANDDALTVIQRVFEKKENSEKQFENSSLFNKIYRSLQYYYGFFDYQQDWGDTAISVVGDSGQVLDFTSNYYRYLLRQLLTLVTSSRPAYEVVPANTDVKSRVQAQLGERILDFYMESKGVLEVIDQAVEDAIVYGTGFVMVTWNPQAGRNVIDEEIPRDADQEPEEFKEGDVEVRRLDFLDVVWDYDQWERDEDLNWIAVRQHVLKADLIARFPEKTEEIEHAGVRIIDEHDPATVEAHKDEDRVEVWHFIHRATDSLPEGRYILALEEEPLLDMDNPYRGLPVYFIRPSKIRKSLLGWTVAFDIQKQQEYLNELLGKMATIHDNLGLPLLWTKTGVKQPDPSMFIGNIAWVESDEKPELVQLSDVPEDIFRAIEFNVTNMERVIGLNSAVQGAAEGSVRANRMQLFMTEQSLRFNSGLEGARNLLFEQVGTAVLEIMQDFPFSERRIQIVGQSQRNAVEAFTAEDLYSVVGVKVKATSPLTRTPEGRIEVAQLLSDFGVSLPKEEILSILNGAPLDALVEGQQKEVDAVNAENEMLMVGRDVIVLPTDNHLFHVKKHASILADPRAREDPQLIETVLAHMMQHLRLYNDPAHFEFQLALGYADIPPSPGPTPPGVAPPGTPGSPGQPSGTPADQRALPGPGPGPSNGQSAPEPEAQGAA